MPSDLCHTPCVVAQGTSRYDASQPTQSTVKESLKQARSRADFSIRSGRSSYAAVLIVKAPLKHAGFRQYTRGSPAPVCPSFWAYGRRTTVIFDASIPGVSQFRGSLPGRGYKFTGNRSESLPLREGCPPL